MDVWLFNVNFAWLNEDMRLSYIDFLFSIMDMWLFIFDFWWCNVNTRMMMMTVAGWYFHWMLIDDLRIYVVVMVVFTVMMLYFMRAVVVAVFHMRCSNGDQKQE